MSHRAVIAVQNRKTLTYSAVYLHNGSADGQSIHALLEAHYTTAAKRSALMKLGDLSQLGEHVGTAPGHSFDTPAAGHVVAYGRDRGEPVQRHEFGGLAGLFTWADGMDAEHIHMYMHGRWNVERVY
jgi:hypothetical protein